MSEEIWSAVDEFVGETPVSHDEALEAALAAATAAGLPEIQVSPPQGKLLQLLARMQGARTVLEFGTLGGLQHDPAWPGAARRLGPALESLAALEDEGAGPFDLTFIDADKVNTPNYFAWALDHSRPGSLIVADNVVRGGTLADAGSDDPATLASAGA